MRILGSWISVAFNNPDRQTYRLKFAIYFLSVLYFPYINITSTSYYVLKNKNNKTKNIELVHMTNLKKLYAKVLFWGGCHF